MGHAAAGNEIYDYIKDAYTLLFGFNIKPWGTIIKNEQRDFGRFTPYIGFDLKKRTLYDYHPFAPKKLNEWILIGSLGAEFSMSKSFSIFTNAAWKYPARKHFTAALTHMNTVSEQGDWNWGFGVKMKVM